MLDEEKGDEEEGRTRRKEGQGEWKNEKVAKGRIIGLAGPCFYKNSKIKKNQRCAFILEMHELKSTNYASYMISNECPDILKIYAQR